MSRPPETAPRRNDPASETRTGRVGHDRAFAIHDGATLSDNTRTSTALLDQAHELRRNGSQYAETRDTASPYLNNLQLASADIGGQYGNNRFGGMLQDAVYRTGDTGGGRTGRHGSDPFAPEHEHMHGREARLRNRTHGDRRNPHLDHQDATQPAFDQSNGGAPGRGPAGRVQPDRLQSDQNHPGRDLQEPKAKPDDPNAPQDYKHLGHRLNYKERVALDKFIHKDDTVGTKYEGTASFYTQGKHTAEGGRYDKDAISVASRTLPFGTMVKVTNPENGNSIIARVSDRGPFTSNKHTGEYNRDLDLSRGAFRQLADLNRGVFKSQWEIVSMPGKN